MTRHTTIRTMSTLLLSGASLVALPSCTDKPPKPTAERSSTASYQPGVPGHTTVNTTTRTANVVETYDSTREVVLDGPDGKRFAVVCGPEVVNFDQIHRGDRVTVTSTEQLAVSMASESDPPDTSGMTDIYLAPKGARPGAVVAHTKQVTATVAEIDANRHTATLQFPDGQTHTVEVRSDIDLSKRKVGEKVVIRVTDAMALRVDKQPAN